MLTTRAQLSDVLAFTRASAAWDIAADGKLTSFGNDAIRSSPGLGWLLEGPATNNRTFSEDFTNAAYTKLNVSVTPASLAAPDGTLTGSALVEAANTNSHYMTLTGPTQHAGSTLYTTSIRVKMTDPARRYVGLSVTSALNSTGASMHANFDLKDGIAQVGAGTPSGYGILPEANGWWRIWISFTSVPSPASGNVLLGFIQAMSNTGTLVYPGDGVSAFGIWGAQNEVGGGPTSYVPATGGSSGSRAVDALVLAGANFTAAIGVPTTGCVVVECNLPQLAPTTKSQHLATISDGNSNLQNRYSLYNAAGGASIFGYLNSAGAAVQTSSAGTLVPGTTLRAAMSWSGGTIAVSVNGGVVQGVVGTTPIGPLTELRIGNSPAGSSALNGRVRLVRVYPYVPSSTELRALSTVGT